MFGISHQKTGLNRPGKYKECSRERALLAHADARYRDGVARFEQARAGAAEQLRRGVGDARALVAQGYKSGVPMGGTLRSLAKAPTFMNR